MARPRFFAPLAEACARSRTGRRMAFLVSRLATATAVGVRAGGLARRGSLALGAILALCGCGGEPLEVSGVVRDGRSGAPIAGARVTADERSVESGEDGSFSIAARRGERVVASAPGRCDAEARVERSPRPITLHLFDRLEIEEPAAQVGFDAEVRVEVRTRCDEGASIAWRQIAGPELGRARMRASADGRVLTVRTHPLDQLVPPDDRPRVVALDRRQRGDYRFELEAEIGGAVVHRTARVLAAPTAAGLYQVPTGADMYLDSGREGDNEWRLLDRPGESRAELAGASARLARLRPDRFGTYTIEHRPTGVRMSVQAGPYEDVPRDCGREGCHAAEAEGWTRTAHATTFRRGIEGALGADFGERCWSCHATGVEPGVENGGLHDTAARAGWRQPAPGPEAWEGAPRRIRRHGSVWCSACHGPGRIVPPQFRWQYGAKYQVGVCARCHDVDAGDPDADHVSPEVDEWRLAAMSRFVRDLRADDPALRRECTRCHSAQGFVAWQRGREELPDRDTVAPIACAACHDAHGATGPAALRAVSAGAFAGAPAEQLGSGALCACCHGGGAATDPDTAPHAPQADVLFGRGARLVPASDEGAHRLVADTCVRCHMARPEPGDPLYGRAGGHTFSMRARRGEPAPNAAACAPCHGGTAPEAIGARDWDGDGTSGGVAAEHERALAASSERLRARIASLAASDRCTPRRVAADVAELDLRLHLVDALGAPLGDCDGDGRLGEGETAVTIAALPRQLADAAHDLAMLRRDGSSGAHNATFAFRVLSAIAAALR